MQSQGLPALLEPSHLAAAGEGHVLQALEQQQQCPTSPMEGPSGTPFKRPGPSKATAAASEMFGQPSETLQALSAPSKMTENLIERQ
ncbi:hypothetical protein WJX74_007987 [Apatococcus lobatus]|uniref:Uncharacterized protein n=1 Tax=Apatococcus lobatus TaxID=904363 RepID=A0AAW1Q207_9CHLO